MTSQLHSNHAEDASANRCPRCTAECLPGANFCPACGARLPDPANAPSDPLLGRVLLERYRVVRLLGAGGMGRVYLAEQRMGTVQRNVAIKVLQVRGTDGAGLKSRFERECELVVQLSHPNTIQFYDFGALDDGTLFIVMEYVSGPSLAKVEQAGPMAPERVERLLRQICGSLDEAHRAGIVHRDLKPENILLTERAGRADFVKVLDFGIAKRTEGKDANEATLTRAGTVLGTPPYMSPEQFAGTAVDARSDIYSLGVIVYELLAGALPFDAHVPWEWARAHASVPPMPFECHPATVNLAPHRKAAVMHALAKNRDERPESAIAFFAEFSGRIRTSGPQPVDGGAVSGVAPTIPGAPLLPSVGTKPTGERVAASVVSGTMPVVALHSDSAAATASARTDPRREEKRRRWPLLVGLGAVTLAGAGLAASTLGRREHAPAEQLARPAPPTAAAPAPVAPAPVAATAPATPAPAAPAAPASPPPAPAAVAAAVSPAPPEAPPEPSEWLAGTPVTSPRGVIHPEAAVGAPDARFAALARGGSLTLEVSAGNEIATDGAAGADLTVRTDPARHAQYFVAVGPSRDAMTLIAMRAEAVEGIDLDVLGLTHTRFVRIENRGEATVYLDAVGAYRVAPAARASTDLHAHAVRSAHRPTTSPAAHLPVPAAPAPVPATPRPNDGFVTPPAAPAPVAPAPEPVAPAAPPQAVPVEPPPYQAPYQPPYQPAPYPPYGGPPRAVPVHPNGQPYGPARPWGPMRPRYFGPWH